MYLYLLYKCPQCQQQIRFSEKDFQCYALNLTPKYNGVFPNSFAGHYNSFLEFICPECKIKTRINYGIYYGDKFPYVKVDSVLTE